MFITTQTVSSAYAATFTTNLSVGSRGEAVKTVQLFLSSQGFFSGTTTGIFNDQTKKAVQAFQKRHNLPATGVWFTITRQKAESLIPKIVRPVQSPVSTSTVAAPVTTKAVSSVAGKNVTLTVILNTGGYVTTSENLISCYDSETCIKSVLQNKKVLLQAYPKEGYEIKGWSEASCGTSSTCSLSMIEDMSVYVYFKIKKSNTTSDAYAELVTPRRPSDTCYITLGNDRCYLRLTWITNLGLAMNIKNDNDEFYLSVKDKNDSSLWQASDLDPVDVAKAVADNVSGPAYLGIFLGAHTISLKSQNRDTILDSTKVKVECAPNTFWNGTHCWQKDAKRLYVFKTDSAVITSMPSGINCGYSPEMCTSGFPSGTVVTVTAVISPGYTFDGWTGDCTGKQLTCSIVMTKDSVVGVRFK